MKRTYTLIVLLGLVMGALLTGCNENKTEPTPGGATNATVPAPTTATNATK